MERLERSICNRVATINFWDNYAKWYKCWMEHNNYHNRIIDVLTTMVEPGWEVLDIGAGDGVLSLPLCAIGCDVRAIEPSTGMRNLLYENAFSRGIDWINVDKRRWEDIPIFELRDYDLMMACNSLHLTEIGFIQSLHKIFLAKPKNVFVITELGQPEIKVKWKYGEYTLAFTKFYEEESSWAFHSISEIEEYWCFMKGRRPDPIEMKEIMARMIIDKDHMWLKEMVNVGMFWWQRIG